MLKDAAARRCRLGADTLKGDDLHLKDGDLHMTKVKLAGTVVRFSRATVGVCMVCACNAEPFDGAQPLDVSDNSNGGGSTGGAGAGGGIAIEATGGVVGPSAAAPADTASSSAMLLATIDAPWGLAVDATTVYVAGQGNPPPSHPLVAIPIAGGQPDSIAVGSNWTVAIDDLRVYWSDGTSILSCAKQNCAGSTTVLAQSGWSHGIGVDATSVYWATTSEGKVMKVDKNGGASSVLASGTYPYELTVDETNVYWTDHDSAGNGTVMGVPSAGGSPVQLAISKDVGTMGIAVDKKNVYFTTGDGKMMQVPKNGGAVLTLSTALGNEPWGIATDGMNVYAVSEPVHGPGAIVRVPVGGGATKVLASGQVAPVGIAVDAAYVYWTDVDAGKVMRIAK